MATATQQNYRFVHHLGSYPVVQDSVKTLQKNLKSTELGRKASEGISQAAEAMMRAAKPIEPYLQRADGYADSSLDKFEERFPIVKAETQDVIQKTRQPFDQAVGAAKRRSEPVVKTRIDPWLAPLLDRAEGLLNKFLPPPKNQPSSSKKQPSTQIDRLGLLTGETISRLSAVVLGSSLRSSAERSVQWIRQNARPLANVSLQKSQKAVRYLQNTYASQRGNQTCIALKARALVQTAIVATVDLYNLVLTSPVMQSAKSKVKPDKNTKDYVKDKVHSHRENLAVKTNGTVEIAKEGVHSVQAKTVHASGRAANKADDLTKRSV